MKRKGWANRLTSGAHEGGKNFAFYKVSIDLTEEGLANYESVVEIMFQYIKMMKEAGVQKWIFDECKSLEEMSFKFKEKTPPADYACDLAQRMHIYADEHVLSGPYLM